MTANGENEKYCTTIIKCSTIQSGGGFWIKYRNVVFTAKKLESLERYLDRKQISWEYINVYGKTSRRFIGRITKK